MTSDGGGEVRDFMPVITGKAAERHRLVRGLTVPRGTMRFAMDLQPQFDYGRQAHTLTISDRGAMFEADGTHVTLHTVGQGSAGNGDGEGVQVRNQGNGLQATWTLRQARPPTWCSSPWAASRAVWRPASWLACSIRRRCSGTTG
jgi:hypothetical protein